MRRATVKLHNKLGLHARASAKLVSVASQFSSEVNIGFNGQTVNGKSIMGIMMLAAAQGSELVLTAEGRDEDKAINALTDLIANRFGEDQ
jgi:phosphocarrier protein HPr